MTELNIGGFEPFSTIDYPYGLSAVVFLQGCPWRCSFCHNEPLLDCSVRGSIKWQTIYSILKGRVSKLDAVVFSGGEPTMQIDALMPAISACRRLSFDVGVHTNGYNPEAVKRLTEAVNWICLDIKASPDKFQEVTGSRTGWGNLLESAKIIVGSGIKYEFRITKHASNSTEDIVGITKALTAIGADKVCLYNVSNGSKKPTLI